LYLFWKVFLRKGEKEDNFYKALQISRFCEEKIVSKTGKTCERLNIERFQIQFLYRTYHVDLFILLQKSLAFLNWRDVSVQ